MSESGLLERGEALSELRSAVRGACRGRGATLLLAGPAGIGKSALLSVLRDLALDQQALVLSARASTLERDFAFGVTRQLLDPVVYARSDPERARLFEGPAAAAAAVFDATSGEPESEYEVLSGLYWLIASLAEERPVVIRVDDLHWADRSSMRLLEFLSRRVEELPVLLAAAIRAGEPATDEQVLNALESSAAARLLEPRPLSRDAVATLLTSTLGKEPEEGFVEAAWDATRGNPLFAAVIAREAAAGRLEGSAREGAELPALAAHGVAPTVAARLGSLPPEALSVARFAAVLGERAPRGDVVALSGLSEQQLSAALATLAEAEILQPAGWSFRHPLVRAAVVELIPRPELEHLHRRAALRLRERGAPAAEIALHWLVAGPAGDPSTVADLREAATAAAAEGATATAVDLLRRALEEGAELPDRHQLLFTLAELELQTMQPAGLERMREALAADLGEEQIARGRAALGKMLMLSDPHSGLAEINAAYAATRDRGNRLRLQASLLEAMVLVDAVSEERREHYAAIRRAAAPSVVELAHLAAEESMAGRLPAGEVAEIAHRATADGVLLEEVGPGGATWNLLAHALRFAERPEESLRILEAGGRAVHERGLRAAGTFVDQAWSYWHRDFGSVARGLIHAQQGYEGILDAELPISTWALTSVIAEHLVLLGRVPEAEELMGAPLGAAEGTFVEPFALTARGLTRMHAGREGEAEGDFRRVVELVDRHDWRAPAAAYGRIRLAELLAGQERCEEALDLLDRDIRVAEAAGTPGALGAALRVRALALQGAERLAGQRRAVEVLGGTAFGLELGRALTELGRTLCERDEQVEARPVLRRALDLASRSESSWLADRAREELKAAGGRPRRERISGLGALTPRERRVAELAAGGMSNREVAEHLWVTPKTVEYHLGNAYAKLGIGSRADLPSALQPD